MARVVDIRGKLSLFSEHWSPKVVATMNNYEVKVAKVKGEFVWHSHADAGDFLVVDGTLTIHSPTAMSLSARAALSCPEGSSTARSRRRRPRSCSSSLPESSTPGAAGGDLTATHDTTLLDD